MNTPHTPMDIHALFRSGRLAEAIAAAQKIVRQQPADRAARCTYGELLVFDGDLDRADSAFAAAAQGELPTTKASLGLNLRRALVRGEARRRQCYEDGRPPLLLTEPSQATKSSLRAITLVREGDIAGAAAAIREVDERRARPSGECGGRRFTEWRDLDDLCAGHLEIISPMGEYLWVDVATISEIRFSPPEVMIDLLWRQTDVRTRDGASIEGYMPVLYVGSHADPDELVKLGRTTRWHSLDDDLSRGVGQRCIWLGEEDTAVLEFERVVLDPPDASTGAAS